jgi:hypothetical protein
MSAKSKPKRDQSPSSDSGSDAGSDSSAEEVKDITPANDKVLTKYNMAAEIVNRVLKVYNNLI